MSDETKDETPDEANEPAAEASEAPSTDAAAGDDSDSAESGAESSTESSTEGAAERAESGLGRRRFWQRRRAESETAPLEPGEPATAAGPAEAAETAGPEAEDVAPADEPDKTTKTEAAEADAVPETEAAAGEGTAAAGGVAAGEAVAAEAPSEETTPAAETAPAARGDRVAVTAVVVVILALAAVGIGLGIAFSGSSSGPTVAKVNGQNITKDQFNLLLSEAKGAFAAQKKPFPTPSQALYGQIKGQIVTVLVQETELEQELQKLHAKPVTDQEVNARLAQIQKQLGGPKKFQQFLKSRGISVAAAHFEIRNQLLQQRAYDTATAGITASDKQVSAYYQKNKAQFKQPASRKVRHILVKTKALADKLEAQLKSGASFAALAKQYSQDPGTKNVGGVLTVNQGQTVPEFDKVAFSIPTNQISPPVHSQFGWHIIEALGPIKPAHQETFSEAAPSIRQQLEQQQKSLAWTKFQQKVASDYKGKVTYAKGYTPPPPATAPTQTAPQTPPTTTSK